MSFTNSSAWDSFTQSQPAPLLPDVNGQPRIGKCKSLGPMVASNSCSCGAQIDIHFCHRQQQNCVQFSIDFEREWDRRYREAKITSAELSALLVVCEKCPLFESRQESRSSDVT